MAAAHPGGNGTCGSLGTAVALGSAQGALGTAVRRVRVEERLHGGRAVRHYSHAVHSGTAVLAAPLLRPACEQGAFFALKAKVALATVPEVRVQLFCDQRPLVDDAVHALRHYLLQTLPAVHRAAVNGARLGLVLEGGLHEALLLSGSAPLAAHLAPLGSWEEDVACARLCSLDHLPPGVLSAADVEETEEREEEVLGGPRSRVHRHRRSSLLERPPRLKRFTVFGSVASASSERVRGDRQRSRAREDEGGNRDGDGEEGPRGREEGTAARSVCAHLALDLHQTVAAATSAAAVALFGENAAADTRLGLFCPSRDEEMEALDARPGDAVACAAGEWLAADAALGAALKHLPHAALLELRPLAPVELILLPLAEEGQERGTQEVDKSPPKSEEQERRRRICTAEVEVEEAGCVLLLVLTQPTPAEEAVSALHSAVASSQFGHECSDEAPDNRERENQQRWISGHRLRHYAGGLLEEAEVVGERAAHVRLSLARWCTLSETGASSPAFGPTDPHDDEEESERDRIDECIGATENRRHTAPVTATPGLDSKDEERRASDDESQGRDEERELTEQEKEVMAAIARFEGSLKPTLLSGEKERLSFSACCCYLPGVGRVAGSLFVTNYQLIFLSASRSTYFTRGADCYVPIPTILKVTEFGGDGGVVGVQIQCKDLRNLLVGLQGSGKGMRDLVRALHTTPATYRPFAFSNKEDRTYTGGVGQGWHLYDAEAEYRRLGLVRANGWRFCRINQTYRLCPSYPSLFVVPAEATDSCVRRVSHFRSKGRVPATVWRHSNGATLTRCSQPSIGFIRRARSVEDEHLVQCIREASPSPSAPLYLLDSRPITNAKANHFRKGGHENINSYPGCKLVFLNIGNIHQVWDSFQRLCSLVQLGKEDGSWLSALESTNWLQMVASVLRGAVQTTRLLHKQGVSVVTHCSDGWDRTPQITSIAQFLLDPYYRTIRGFAVLLEKEWLSFGHRFATRCGHGDQPQQLSPVFLVFLDCVWQVCRQYPCSAEFSERFLLLIFDHVHSCRFGTFLFDSERERQHASVCERTVSLWTFVEEELRKSDDLRNLFYRRNEEVLLPSAAMRRLRLWSACYERYVTAGRRQESVEDVAGPLLRQSSRLRTHLGVEEVAPTASPSPL